MAWPSRGGVHRKPFVDHLPVATLVNVQPAMENVVEIGGFPVSRGIELGYGGHFPIDGGHQVVGPAVVRVVLVTDDRTLEPVPGFFLGKPVREIFVTVEGTGGELRRPADFAPTQFSEFQSHGFSYSKFSFQAPVSKASMYDRIEWCSSLLQGPNLRILCRKEKPLQNEVIKASWRYMHKPPHRQGHGGGS